MGVCVGGFCSRWFLILLSTFSIEKMMATHEAHEGEGVGENFD